MRMKWKRSVLSKIEGIYCVEVLHTNTGIKIAAASELRHGICKIIDFKSREEEIVWNGPGGCMNVAQWKEDGSLIGVQNFYKGAQALDAQVAVAYREGRGWVTKVLAKLPYLHHCGVVYVEGRAYVIACTLCTKREFQGDWSHPGRIQVLEVPDPAEHPEPVQGPEPADSFGAHGDIRIIRDGITKNHGFWQGMLDNRQVTLVSGNALYCVTAPKTKGDDWRTEILIEREISDIAVADIDGDGEDEILAFEGLHGNQATINKRVNGQWKVIYSCPMEFAHGIWGGTLLGKPVFVIGSMKGEGERSVLSFTRDQGNGAFLRTVLETGIGPSNIRGLSHEGKDYILAAAREAGELVLFELY